MQVQKYKSLGKNWEVGTSRNCRLEGSVGQIGDCAQQVEMFEGSIKMLGICRTVKHHKTSENVNPRRS